MDQGEKVRVVRKGRGKSGASATDIALMSSAPANSRESLPWDKDTLVADLVAADVPMETAREVADAVEGRVINGGHPSVTTGFIRELVDVELMDRGLASNFMKHTSIGLSVADLEQIVTNANNENSNTTHNPESVNLTIAETVLKQYAFSHVFSEPVSEAHTMGDMHVHDAGFVIRPYCGGHSIEYIKKYGLKLPTITSESSPAKHAEVLVGHHVKMATGLQVHYAGAVGWDAVNMFYAPFFTYERFEDRFGAMFDPATRGTDAYKSEYRKWVGQVAQMLIFEFNQLAGARGAQAVFTDFNLYFHTPSHYVETPAVLPGGVYGVRGKDGAVTEYATQEAAQVAEDRGEGTLLRYKHFERESKAFLYALFETYLAGDRDGQTFFFPKPLLHISEDFYATKGAEKFMNLACTVASKQGITYFVFDRGSEPSVSQCCRLKIVLDEEAIKNTMHPESLRFTGLQNVTLNLPRIAYRAKGSDEAMFKEIDRLLGLCIEAHLEKKKYINGLMSLGASGPLGMLTTGRDGKPYMDMNNLTFLVGLMGLNELVQAHTGEQLHQSRKAMKLGLRIIAHMSIKVEELGAAAGLKVVLEESPAESSGYRLARLDMQYFPEQAKRVVKGTLSGDSYYYTNSVHLAYDAPIDYVDRVAQQALFSPMIKAGSICLSYDQDILVSQDGESRLAPIGEIVDGWLDEPGEAASGISGVTISSPGGPTEVLAAARVPLNGRQVIRVKSRDGRDILCTEDHPVRAMVGGVLEWIPAGELQAGQTLLREASLPGITMDAIDLLPMLIERPGDITLIDHDGHLSVAAKRAGCTIMYPSRPTCSLEAAIAAIGVEGVREAIAGGGVRWKARNAGAEMPFSLAIDSTMGTFIGLMLAEGHRLSDESASYENGVYNLGATFNKSERAYIEAYERAFEDIFGKASRRTYGKTSGHVTVGTSDKSIHLILSTVLDMGRNCLERKIPDVMYSASPDVLLSMVDGMFAGDGTSAYNDDGQLRELIYYTSSPRLKRDLVSMLGLLGFRSSMNRSGPASVGVGRDEASRLISLLPMTQMKLREGSWAPERRMSLSNGDMLRSADTPLKNVRALIMPSRFTPRHLPILKGLRGTPWRETVSTESAIRYAEDLMAACMAALSLSGTPQFARAYAYAEAGQSTGRSFRAIRNTMEDGYNVKGSVRTATRDSISSAVSMAVLEKESDIRNAVKTLREFISTISRPGIGFDAVESAESIAYGGEFVYDIMTASGEFSVPSGLVCHNCHIWLGEQEPHPKALAEFVRSTLNNTQSEQIAFSPEFTVCEDCGKTSRGLLKACPSCGSYHAYWVTRIVGYYSKVQTWNKGKLAELDDRTRGIDA